MRWLALLAILITLPASAAYYAFAGGAFTFEDEELVAIPDVVGQASSGDADTILEGVGLDAGTVTSHCSAATSGQVVDQSPPAGVEVPLGTLVNLGTSDGNLCHGKPPLWLYLETQR